MRPMNNVDYHYLVRELNTVLPGSFLNQIYDLGPGAFRFKFKAKQEHNLQVHLGQSAYLTPQLPEPLPVSSFVRLLRDHLENARVLKVEQLQQDRIFCVRLKKAEESILIFEMLKQGNMVLCTSDFQIVDAWKRAAYTHRKLGPKQKYALPPNDKLPAEKLTLALLSSWNGKLVSALSKHVNVSPFYLEEACAMSDLSLDTMVESLAEEDRKILVDEVRSLFSRPLAPVVYFDGETAVEFAAYPLAKMRPAAPAKYATFSEAIEAYYSHAREAPKEDPEMQRLRHTLQEQERALAELEQGEQEARKKAEAIYLHYDKLFEELEKAKVGKLKKITVTL